MKSMKLIKLGDRYYRRGRIDLLEIIRGGGNSEVAQHGKELTTNTDEWSLTAGPHGGRQNLPPES